MQEEMSERILYVKNVRKYLVMKMLISDKRVGFSVEGLVLLSEIYKEGNVNVAVLKCYGGNYSR